MVLVYASLTKLAFDKQLRCTIVVPYTYKQFHIFFKNLLQKLQWLVNYLIIVQMDCICPTLQYISNSVGCRHPTFNME